MASSDHHVFRPGDACQASVMWVIIGLGNVLAVWYQATTETINGICWNMNQNSNIYNQEDVFKMPFAKFWSLCLDFIVLC